MLLTWFRFQLYQLFDFSVICLLCFCDSSDCLLHCCFYGFNEVTYRSSSQQTDFRDSAVRAELKTSGKHPLNGNSRSGGRVIISVVRHGSTQQEAPGARSVIPASSGLRGKEDDVIIGNNDDADEELQNNQRLQTAGKVWNMFNLSRSQRHWITATGPDTTNNSWFYIMSLHLLVFTLYDLLLCQNQGKRQSSFRSRPDSKIKLADSLREGTVWTHVTDFKIKAPFFSPLTALDGGCRL